MKKEDIIQMAREAGFIQGEGKWVDGLFNPHTEDECSLTDELERFATLVAAAEREACAKLVEQTPFSNWFQSDCVAAIRARGQV